MTVNFTETLTDGSTVHIRPINHDDLERERSFFDNLSKESMYFRFLGGVSQLTDAELRNFCDIDRKREMAFIALDPGGKEDRQVGVARYVANSDDLDAEFAVTIADSWQDRDLDAALFQHLIDYARDCGIEVLYSIDLSSNTNMRALAQKFEISSRVDPSDATQIVYELDLEPHNRKLTG